MDTSGIVPVYCAIFLFNRVQCLLPMLCESSSRILQHKTPHPWLARLVPHPRYVSLTICPAVCIHPNVFYTAARCLVGLTIGWVSVEYRGGYLRVKSLLWTRGPPYHRSDGFAVTESTGDVEWRTVPYFTGRKYQLENFENEEGLAMMKAMTLILNRGQVNMVELDVVVDKEMSQKRYDRKNQYNNIYHQWAFHPCTADEIKKALPKCELYIKVTGAPVVYFNHTSGENFVMGVSTWGDCSNLKANYPVAFTYISLSEIPDLECAQLIAKDETHYPEKGYYDQLCRSRIKPANEGIDGDEE